MTTTLNYTEAAAILGVHRESVANYVRRGLLTISSTNSKAVTMESVQNLINKHHEVLDITKEVEQMKEDLQKERDQLSALRQEVKDKIEYNKVKGITFQNIGYICDALLVYLDLFGDCLSTREKEVVRAVFAHTDLSVIADDKGLTHNRIREIFHKSLRKLAHSRSMAQMKQDHDELKEQAVMKDELIQSLRARIETLKDKLHIEEVMSGQDDAYVSVPSVLMRPISEISLSVRSYNCLRAADVEFVYELAFLSRNDLVRWRNFGRKSLNEVEILKEQLGILDGRITDVRKFKDVRGEDRQAVPLIVLENKRRKWQKR